MKKKEDSEMGRGGDSERARGRDWHIETGLNRVTP